MAETALSRTRGRSRPFPVFTPKRTCVIIRESAVPRRSRDHKISHQFLARVSGLSRIARIRLMQPANDAPAEKPGSAEHRPTVPRLTSEGVDRGMSGQDQPL
jgi:hypothetical protein